MSKKELKQANHKADLKQYPNDFCQLNSLLQPKEDNINNAEEKIHINKFFLWLHAHNSSFSLAKNKMIERGLVLATDYKPTSAADYANKYALEYTCTCLAHYFLENDQILKQVPALKEKHDKIRTSMKFVDSALKEEGTLPFENSVMQHIFQIAQVTFYPTKAYARP